MIQLEPIGRRLDRTDLLIWQSPGRTELMQMKQIPIFDFTDLPQNSVSRQVTAVEQLGILCGLNRRTSRRLAKTVFLILSNYPLESFVENSISFIQAESGWAIQFLFSTDSISPNQLPAMKGFLNLRRAGERLEEFEIRGSPEECLEIHFSQSLAVGFEIPKSRELKQWARIISSGDWEEAFSQLNRIYLASRSKVQQLRDGISIQREVLESDKGQADAILSLVASKTDNPVIILDKTGSIEWVNVAFHQLTGVDAQQDIKANIADVLFSHASDQSVRTSFEQSLTGENSFLFEYCWRCETKTESEPEKQVAWIEFQATPIRDENDFVVRWIAIGSNVTQRRQAELAMKAARDLAESASKAKSEFLAMMSHEIRTPMNAILGMTELTLGSDLTIEQREYLTTANNSAQALLEILNDILDLSKVEANRLELEQTDFNLADLVRETLDTMAFLAQKKDLPLDCLFPVTIPQQLVGDPVRFRQVLVNLVGNSIKFTASGEIVVETELTDETEERVTLHFRVRDTGIGITEDKISRIFEAFYQADATVTPDYGGTGLGLSITSELVRLMGGRIWVESVTGKGSTFHFVISFPKSKRSALASVPIAVGPAISTVVIVSSEYPASGPLAVWCQELGIATVTFASVAEFSTWVGNQVGLAGVVAILDTDSPGDEVFQIAERLRQEHGIHSIITFAAGDRVKSIRLCRKHAIENYLVKPVSPKSLTASLNFVLGRSTADPRLANPNAKLDGSKIGLTDHQLNILVVDDHPSNRVLVGEILKRRGHAWKQAANGMEAIDQIKVNDFDVVLMDVQMPDHDGLQTTALIRKLPGRKALIPIIATTAYVTEDDRQRCLDASMDDYLAKPIDLIKLIEKAERWGNTQRNDATRIDTIDGLGNQLLIQDVPDWATGIAQTVLVAHENSDPGELNENDARHRNSKESPNNEAHTHGFEPALARFAGDRELLKMQMGFFLKETPELLSSIERAIADGDAKLLHTCSHRLKGLIRTFDDELGAELATKLEDMGRDSSIEDAPSVLSLLASCVNALKVSIEGYLSS